MKTVPYDTGPRLLDVMETAVFDYVIGQCLLNSLLVCNLKLIYLYLKVACVCVCACVCVHMCAYTLSSCWLSLPAGNADRHHYETFRADGNNGRLLHLDNGKGCVWAYVHMHAYKAWCVVWYCMYVCRKVTDQSAVAQQMAPHGLAIQSYLRSD